MNPPLLLWQAGDSKGFYYCWRKKVIHVCISDTVPSAMIFWMVVPSVMKPLEVVIAPAAAVPAFITTQEVGWVVANVDTAPSRRLPAVTWKPEAVWV
jgi:hypothetical protein